MAKAWRRRRRLLAYQSKASAINHRVFLGAAGGVIEGVISIDGVEMAKRHLAKKKWRGETGGEKMLK